MRHYAGALSCLAMAALAVGGAPACSLGLDDPGTVNLQPPREPATASRSSGDPGTIVVRPARVPVIGSPAYYERLSSLPPPSGPLVSRLVAPQLVNVRAAQESRSGQAAAALASASAPAPLPGASAPAAPPVRWQVAPEVPMVMAAVPLESTGVPEKLASQLTAAPGESAIAVIPFGPRSPNLTDATRKELDEVAKRITDMRLRQVELRAFAAGGDIDNRKIALARALVVRSYLLDCGVKARLEVGSFDGEGEHVEILVPKT